MTLQEQQEKILDQLSEQRAVGHLPMVSKQEIENNSFICRDGGNHDFQIAQADFTFGFSHHPETGTRTYGKTGFIIRKFVCMKCSMIKNFGINLLFMENDK